MEEVQEEEGEVQDKKEVQERGEDE